MDESGNFITTTEQQLKLWANFLEKKFGALPDEPEIELAEPPNQIASTPTITLDEVKICVKHLKSGKATGPDLVPVEQYKASDDATFELFEVLKSIWEEATIQNDFTLTDMILLCKKKSKQSSNDRALGLLNHEYNIFAMLLLMHMLPFITPKLSDMQAGFRKGRGYRDNITILAMTVNHLLKSAESDVVQGVIPYIDFTAAFDSILHSYLINTLKEYEVPLKYCRLVKAIYDSAAVRVRLQDPGGHRSHSRNINIRRGVIQGDIPSPICFLVALDKLLKDHGISLTQNLMLSELVYADDYPLPYTDGRIATQRLTILEAHTKTEAGMTISIPKTKVQHIKVQPRMTCTTEEDISNLPPEK